MSQGEAREDLPRSEAAHPATEKLDALAAREIVDLLHRCDGEFFTGIEADDFVGSCAQAFRALRRASSVILAGAGTSGRLAYLLARRHAAPLARVGIRVLPWIAGGERALVLPVEGAEDDVDAARRALAPHLGPASCFVGISCGLSAPCVAAGIDEAASRGAQSVVLGMNDPRSARTSPLSGLAGGFAQALARADVVLTPDVGSEALTGSSRMKGGSATWVVLDTILSLLTEPSAKHESFDAAAAIQRCFATARAETFEAARREERARVLEACAEALRAGARVRVFGRGDAGLAAVLDASECPPTFGASPDEVRAFVEDGWQGYASIFDAESWASLPAIDFDAGLRDLKTGSNPRDVVVLVGDEDERASLADRFRAGLDELGVRVLQLDCDGMLEAKLALNAVSTGAFTRAGKVYRNRMIDVAISNAKLFDRAVRIVADLAPCAHEDARQSVLAALHDREDAIGELEALPVEAHIARARRGVVPRALLHARGYSLEQAREALAKEPVVRDALRVLEDSRGAN